MMNDESTTTPDRSNSDAITDTDTDTDANSDEALARRLIDATASYEADLEMNATSAKALLAIHDRLDRDNENGLYYGLIRNLLTADLDTLMHFEDCDKVRADFIDEADNDAITDDEIRATVTHLYNIAANHYYTDELSNLAISFSLCPMHFCDWASCFDDADPACSQIRAIFPNCHDT